MFDSPWRVLHVVANHEKRVAQHLGARSLEHYLPLYAVRSKWTDRTVNLKRPLFAGYVFVRFPGEARISVVSTPGVLRLLGNGVGETVSTAEIERIREGLAGGYILRPHPAVSIGERVRVHRGVFEGVEGIVTELRHRVQGHHRPCRNQAVLLAGSGSGRHRSLAQAGRRASALRKKEIGGVPRVAEGRGPS